MYITKSKRKSHGRNMFILVFIIGVWVAVAIYALVLFESDSIPASTSPQASAENEVASQGESLISTVRLDEYSFEFSYNNRVDYFGQTIDLGLVNLSANTHDMQINILDSEDTMIYTSQKVPAGYQLRTCTINAELASGEHEMKLVVSIFDGDTVLDESEHPLIFDAN